MASNKRGAGAEAKAEATSQDKRFVDHDGRCAYVWSGQRCPLPGNISDTPGRGGRFYCMWHRHAENRKPSFQAAHFEIFDTEEKVREWVEMNYQTRVQDDVIANIDPDWYRKPGEARSEYLERMRTVRENLVAVRALEHEEVAADGN